MYTVYVLKSEKSGKRYIGVTNELERRLKEHNSGKTKSTKGYTPWKLVYLEEYPDFNQARKRELYLKSGIGREFLNHKLSAPVA